MDQSTSSGLPPAHQEITKSGYGYEVSLRRLTDQPPKGGFVGVAHDFQSGARASPVVHLRGRGSTVGVGRRSAARLREATSAAAVTGSHSWRASPVVHLRGRGSAIGVGRRSAARLTEGDFNHRGPLEAKASGYGYEVGLRRLTDQTLLLTNLGDSRIMGTFPFKERIIRCQNVRQL